MRLKHLILTFLLVAQSVSFCQEPLTTTQMKQMLEVSQRRGQLEAEGAAPFHLVASFEWFDVTGKIQGKGSLDELWESPKRYRKFLTFSGEQLVEIDNGTQAWRTGKWGILEPVALGVMSVLTPFLERPSGNRLNLEMSKQSVNLDCVGTEPDLPGVSESTRLALTTYCMSKGSHLLRLITRPNLIEIAFNGVEPFGKTYIPRTIQVAIKGRAGLRLHVDTIEPASDFSALETPAPQDAQMLGFHRADLPPITGELKHAQVLTKVSPQYPQAGMRGKVVVKVHIDTTGAVESAEVLSADNQILKAPVMTAVKQWTYRAAYRGDKVVDDYQVLTFNYGQDDAE
jgi:TonB family protein